jgi:hypothetical protein
MSFAFDLYLNLGQEMEEDAELIDEDELLDDADMAAPVASAADDCEVRRREGKSVSVSPQAQK